MDETHKQCQDDMTINDCLTKEYIDALKKKCKCLPLHLQLTDQVFLKERDVRKRLLHLN